MAVMLLLANVICGIWFGWYAPPRSPSRPSPGGDLRLITQPLPEDLGCFTLEPPPDTGEGQGLTRRLQNQVMDMSWQEPQTEITFKVHLRPFDNLKQARRALMRLHTAGVKNAALGTGRGWTNVVVLGGYADRSRAVKRRNDARDKGFDVSVTERQRELRPGRLVIRTNTAPSSPEGHQWIPRHCDL